MTLTGISAADTHSGEKHDHTQQNGNGIKNKVIKNRRRHAHTRTHTHTHTHTIAVPREAHAPSGPTELKQAHSRQPHPLSADPLAFPSRSAKGNGGCETGGRPTSHVTQQHGLIRLATHTLSPLSPPPNPRDRTHVLSPANTPFC